MSDNESTWGFVFLLVVLILCAVAVKEGYDQRESRLAWMDNITQGLKDARDQNDLVALACLESIGNLKQSTDEQVRKLLAENVVPPGQPQQYNHVAGCYGIVPTNSTEFSLLCNKNFAWD